MVPVVDCHALLASADQQAFPLAAGIAPLRPGELEQCPSPADMAGALVDGLPQAAILVQRGRFYGFDNRLILHVAAGDHRLRALCAVDARLPGAAVQARHLLQGRHVAGLRLMEPEKGGGLDWLAGDHAEAVWHAVADAGAVMDVHVFPWNRAAALPQLARLMRRFPQVPVVLDNLGNGPVEAAAADFGLDALMLGELADMPQLTCKFSEMTLGKLDGAGLDHTAAVARYAGVLGAQRLVWGSDVLPPGMTLAAAAMRAVSAVAGVDPAARDLILGGNARRLFGFAAE